MAVVLIRVVAASINPVDVATMHYGAFPGSLSEADIRVVVGNDARVKFMKPGRDAEVLVWKQLQILLLQNRNE